MLEHFKRVWFQVFDRPRCAACHGYSRPSQLVCSDDCESKLRALGLLDGPSQHGLSRSAAGAREIEAPNASVFEVSVVAGQDPALYRSQIQPRPDHTNVAVGMKQSGHLPSFAVKHP